MKDLVTTLKAQHQAISELMSDVERSIERQDAAAAGARLETLKVMVLTHLEMEHRELYPALMTGARKNPDTVVTAKLFAENILRITESALTFFRKHAAGSIEMDALTRDWRTFVGIIAGRCESEEAVLYPLYENMARVGPAVALRVAV